MPSNEIAIVITKPSEEEGGVPLRYISRKWLNAYSRETGKSASDGVAKAFYLYGATAFAIEEIGTKRFEVVKRRDIPSQEDVEFHTFQITKTRI